MVTNPKAKTILCYGDCNVHGYISLTEERFPANIRWPGGLQDILGNDYYVIEEGLTRRNTGFEDPDYMGMNGASYLVPCLLSHNPLDWIVLWLSTRDHKDKFNLSSSQTAENMEKLVKLCKKYGRNKSGSIPNILLIAPTIVTKDISKFSNRYYGAVKKSKEIASLYRNIAENENLFFLDASVITSPSSKDGMHLTPRGHAKIARAVSEIIF